MNRLIHLVIMACSLLCVVSVQAEDDDSNIEPTVISIENTDDSKEDTVKKLDADTADEEEEEPDCD